MRLYIILILGLLCTQPYYAQISFTDRASILGINTNSGNSNFGGTGVSFADYNNDDLDDITLASGDGIPVLFYKNMEGSFFVQESLLPSQLYDYKTRSVTWIDFDNDGDKDLFLTSDTNGNRLFENRSDNLVDITIIAGFPLDNLYTYGASWGDYNNDGFLDVYLSNRIGGTFITNYFFKNNGNGTFSDVTNSVGLSNEPALSFCSAFLDFNNDGWQDLYVANDKFKPNYLYKNNGDGTFTDVSAVSGTNVIIDAMSVTVDDYNNDGFVDIFMTNTPENISTDYAPGTVLLKNNGDETFTDVTSVTNTNLESFSWGSSFFDADNDGDLDLYINTQYTNLDPLPAYAFFLNSNSTFTSPTNVGFSTNSYKSYSCAIGDYNNDGRLEIVSNNDGDTPPSLWENTATNSNNNFISVKLQGVFSNKDGVGSSIEISINGNKQFRYVHCGEGYLSQNSFTEHIGIGNATAIDYIKVTWLSGTIDTLFNVTANQVIDIVEGSTLSIEDFNAIDKLNAYPNPVKKVLTLVAPQNIDAVSVYNMLGQEVLRSTPDTLNAEVDMSTLKAGAYFVKVSIDKNVKTVRVIRQ